MRGVKGQVTVFVIVGLVLLLSFVLIMSVQQTALNKKLDSQAKDAVTDFVELNSLNQYVKGCLDLVASDGLSLLGEQGGVLYQYQGGLTPSPQTNFFEGRDYMPLTFFRTERGNNENGESYTYLEKVNRNISYGVQARVDCLEFQGPFPALLDVLPTSYYPVKNLYFLDYVSQFRYHYTNHGCYGYDDPYISVSGFLGANKFPRLCSYNGSNAFDPYARISPCKPNQYDSKSDPFSMQRQLETYIKNNLGSCVNLSYYSQFTGSPISVNEKNVEIKTTLLQPRGIVVDAYYPINVQVGTRSILQQANFQTQLDTNVRQLYDYVSKLLIDYVRDPTFNLLRDWNSTQNRYYKDSFNLFFYQAPCVNCQRDSTKSDYVLTIVDKSSLLKGRPWTINTAIQQRKPVLDYMHDPGQDSTFQGEKIDYQFFANSTIRLEPNGIDPELGNLTYDYYGWKEDYDQYLNWTKCVEDEPSGCNLSNFADYVITDTSQAPHKWTTNQEYLSSGRTSQWNTSNGDVGLHNVTVVVTDKQGKKDFQVVKILIFDLPKAKLNMSNGYDDISNDWASIEDNYTLDGSASQASMMAGGDIDGYVFWDDVEGFVISSIASKINISETFWNATLDYFKGKTWDDIVGTSGDTFVDHKILLVVKQNQSGVIIQSPPSIKNVSVAQCLPHGYISDDDTTFNPLLDYDISSSSSINGGLGYYYNTNNDLFNSPHVCCEPLVLNPADPNNLGGGKFASVSTVCFNKDFYMTLPDLDKDDPYPYLEGSLIDNGTGAIGVYNYSVHVGQQLINDPYTLFNGINVNDLRNEKVNDLFRLKMSQKCSGTRGNVCAGAFDFVWSQTDNMKCNDFNQVQDQFARCQGPGLDSLGPFTQRKTNIDLSESYDDSKLACQNFTSDNSYEKNVLDISPSTHSGWTQDEAQAIQDGYCAPPKAASISLSGEITVDTNSNSVADLDFESSTIATPYTCNARCNGGSGECDYFEDSQCICTQTVFSQGGDVTYCDGIKASRFENLFNTNNENVYVCASGVACDVSCEAHTVLQSNKAACYCATQQNIEGAFSESDMGTFDTWFATNSGDESCCQSGNYFDSPGDDKVCWNGIVKLDNDRFENNRLLSFGGLVYCCEDQNNDCPSFVNFNSLNPKVKDVVIGNYHCHDNGQWQ